jgi:hypothetical protein
MKTPIDPPNANIDPKPFKVPLTLEDVPPGSALRQIGSNDWNLINRADEDGVECRGWSNFLYDQLMEKYEIKVPGEDWKPAHKIDYAV